MSADRLDALLHQPVRTAIAAYLAGAGEATFNDLKRRIEVSDGNLESHLKKLIAADYVAVRRDTAGPRPVSSYTLTDRGRTALAAYVAALYALLPLAPASETPRTDGTANLWLPTGV
jgi:DNA-binding MarR family transcriptional regulator